MASARNKVIDGDYKGKPVVKHKKYASISATFTDVPLTKDKVVAFDVVSEAHQKSASSGIAKGMVGGALFGGIGAIAGATSGKTKGTYLVHVTFANGKQSLMELNDELYRLVADNLAVLPYRPAPEPPREPTAEELREEAERKERQEKKKKEKKEKKENKAKQKEEAKRERMSISQAASLVPPSEPEESEEDAEEKGTLNAEPEAAPTASPETAAPPFSVADELLKFKNLLDMGAITQEEFDRKKQQLLNL